MISTHGVLVECEDTDNSEIYTNSGLLFRDKFVIITGNVLMPYLKSNTNDLNAWLLNMQAGKLHFSPFSTFSRKPSLKIVFKKENQTMRFKEAEVVASFICKNILNSSSRYLHDWAIDFEDKQYQAKQFLSLFFILQIMNDIDVSDINLEVPLTELLKTANKWSLETGKDVFTESAPFGNRGFLNSYSQGIISNVTGEYSCFLLTDCPSAPGSEGCPLFIKTKSKIRYPVGIVISCLNWWKGEWVGMTLCANLVPLLSQIVPNHLRFDIDIHFKYENHVHHNLLFACTNSLVQVISGTAWGTGILLDKKKGIFLTNSHVIENDQNITLHWKDEQMETKLLYKTPESQVYDIGVMQSNMDIINKFDMPQVKLSLEPAVIGEEIFAAGYPLFPRDLKPKPTLTRGYISQTHRSMIKTTCTVLPGSSGGAIFRPDGKLLAVIVSNTRIDDTGVVYPRVNMAIPILTIYDIIYRFLYTDDVEVLKEFHSKDLDTFKQWTHFTGKL